MTEIIDTTRSFTGSGMTNRCQRRLRVRDISYRRAFLRDRLNVWLRLAANPRWQYTARQARRNAARIRYTLTQLG